MKKILLYTILFAFFSSCENTGNRDFQLPKMTSLNSYGFFDPFFAEQLIDPPFKSNVMWNDSLLSLCRIYRMEFIQKGGKNPENINEEFVYKFNSSGNIKNFTYFNFALSQKAYTSMKFKNSKKKLESIKIPLFFGRKNKQEVLVKHLRYRTIYIRKKENNIQDSSLIYYINNEPVVYMEKLGDFVSKIQFKQDVNQPLIELEPYLKVIGVSEEAFLLAEKSITFMEDGLPQKTYQLNENFIKDAMIGEWLYSHNKKLIAYKKYINNHCVKDIHFNYSEDKILRSFTFNRKTYEVKYN